MLPHSPDPAPPVIREHVRVILLAQRPAPMGETAVVGGREMASRALLRRDSWRWSLTPCCTPLAHRWRTPLLSSVRRRHRVRVAY
ncbi:hypothetical protein Krad_2315 [Kineococcus radiotolerans SRS30216 = ATCC BAA-149]|uniref:Uncharacterized protein n=1 Tax=Kineococcus radiotolerans (strain ATCC BAA-149 / DSM 14245 / SRS30216) TaxID=266940 RepID=A6WAF7_KINRD|nr:hypothetical protein Krad_2315 [Kineococcus radiotolerans SRS30216 = ATCC BAA-149]